MIVYSVTQDNPEGIDRYQLFTTKELADKVASLWVDRDNERRQEMFADHPEELERYEWRWIKESGYWGYGSCDDQGEFFPIYTIMVSEMEIYETIPEE